MDERLGPSSPGTTLKTRRQKESKMEKPTAVPPQVNPELVEKVQAASKVMHLTDKDLCECLKLLGINWVEEDALDLLLSETTTEQDAEKIFTGTRAHVPIARFRAGWAILKGKKTEPQGNHIGESPVDILKHLRPVDQWSDEDLINSYDQNCSTKIFTELRERSKNRRFVAFDENGIYARFRKPAFSVTVENACSKQGECQERCVRP